MASYNKIPIKEVDAYLKKHNLKLTGPESLRRSRRNAHFSGQNPKVKEKRAKTEDGVNGVPFFTVHGLRVNSSILNKLSGNSLSSFSGAQATEFWLEIFESFLK